MRLFIHLALLALAGIFVTGCSAEYFRAEDETLCKSVGFEANTEAFSRCLLDLELERRARVGRAWR